jgi:hypothetical protein
MKFTRISWLLVSAFSLAGCREDEKELSAVKINRITVLEYPVTNGGVPWDDPLIGSATGPDVTWKISGPENKASGVYFEDADGSPLAFETGFPVILNSPGSTHYLELWDVDDLDGSDIGSADDKMVSIAWKPYTGNGESGTEWVEITGPNAVVNIQVTYMFE